MQTSSRLLIVAALVATFVPAPALGQAPYYAEIQHVPAPDPVRNGLFGRSVVGLGDVDGDAHPDVAVAEPGSGEVHVISGRDGALIYTAALGAGADSGLHVAASDDVTGDGVRDLAVAVGRARVVLLSGANGEAVWTAEGPGASPTRFGAALAGIGDVSEDGVPDVAVGAPGADVDGVQDAGAAYVLSGADGSVLSSLTSPSPMRFGGFGSALAGTRDGVAVGAPAEVADSTSRGHVYVFASGSLVRTIPAPSGADYFGSTLTGVGDLNGDVVDDLVVGTPSANVGGAYEAGRAYAVSGATGEALYSLTSTDPDYGAQFGATAAPVRDLDGDGVGELAVGAPGAGRVTLFSGRTGTALKLLSGPYAGSLGTATDHFGSSIVEVTPAGGRTVRLAVGAPDFEFDRRGRVDIVALHPGDALDGGAVVFTPTPGRPRGHFGTAVAVLDDVDGDGRPDYLVGARGEARAYVMTGDGTTLYTVSPPDPSESVWFGGEADVTCDVDGDGVRDFVIGNELTLRGPGAASVFSGANGALLYSLSSPDPVEGGGFGHAVASTPDADGDGFCDIAVGAPREDGPNYAGRAYLFSGRDGSLVHAFNAPDGRASREFGKAVAGVGDIDGDGLGELAVGAPSYDGGRVHVFAGSDGSPTLTLNYPGAHNPGHSFGRSLTGPGDIDGDGVPDVVVGASTTQLAPYLYALSGADGSPIYALDAPAAGLWYGLRLSPAGDLDGDGVGDFAVAASGSREPARVYLMDGEDGSILGTIWHPLGRTEGVGVFDIGSGVAVVGASYENEGNVPSAGRAYVVPIASLVTSTEFDGPGEAAMAHAYPNPTPGPITFSLHLRYPGPVTVRFFDMLGRTVRKPLELEMEAGTQDVRVDLGDLAHGVYAASIETSGGRYVQLITVH
ncbi:FG-GAP-like repeat-containing protein [Rubricoccus marinus]|uniref:Secretion system C-terminal sorting domain-containing protein n=1 Tax=Rubricoccus marinus TaxID=716817 RepID=A0A259TVG5_9BACT|nr:FG-GAP-like repeat-containing protein [Rubricoccus marinus]OZC01755.1 hypothetical protein BSZ36_01385 [Rubricoccus marinus]